MAAGSRNLPFHLQSLDKYCPHSTRSHARGGRGLSGADEECLVFTSLIRDARSRVSLPAAVARSVGRGDVGRHRVISAGRRESLAMARRAPARAVRVQERTRVRLYVSLSACAGFAHFPSESASLPPSLSLQRKRDP